MTDEMDEVIKMVESQKKWIDESDYFTLLRKWRFAKDGDALLQGEVGQYYKEVMFRKRDALPEGEAALISKEVGWERP